MKHRDFRLAFSSFQNETPINRHNKKSLGLGYNLLVLVYDKKDESNTSRLNFLNCTFVSAERTADFTTTKRLIEMLNDGASKDDIVAYFYDIGIPGDEIMLNQLADDVFRYEILQGYLTISNALQWRLNYRRVISLNNSVRGIVNYDY